MRSKFSGVILLRAALTFLWTISGSMWPSLVPADVAAARPTLVGFQPDDEMVIGLTSMPAVRGMRLAAWASLALWLSRRLPPRRLPWRGVLEPMPCEALRDMELDMGKAPPGRLNEFMGLG